MRIHRGSVPTRYVIIDGFVRPEELRAINDAWPVGDWEGWVAYDPRYEAKRASNLTTPIPVVCASMLALLAKVNLGSYLGMPDAVPDLSLHGGGLHEFQPGGKLGCHLDADTHPRLGLRRAYSAILWVHEEWHQRAGGRLQLLDKSKTVVQEIEPLPGRLAAFDCRDTWHAVEEVSQSATWPRRSLALFGYLRQAGGPHTRTRAHFAPMQGEEHLAEAMLSR